MDYPDGRSFTSRLEYLDDYHFDMGGFGNVFHICQFAEVMERNGCRLLPGNSDAGRTGCMGTGRQGLYHHPVHVMRAGTTPSTTETYSVMDSGQVNDPELTIQEVREANSGSTSHGKGSAADYRTTMQSWIKLRKPRN
ncbi:MAG: hypothetical protein ACLRLT_16910 [Sellimonas intestinalis]|uniref:hypothetical protein n=1 Tax=Sellimonas intestinalis TaxID=1653434 RepID=UPI0039A059E7